MIVWDVRANSAVKNENPRLDLGISCVWRGKTFAIAIVEFCRLVGLQDEGVILASIKTPILNGRGNQANGCSLCLLLRGQT